ncbi:MAG: hypothetical protein Aurels2KO_28600 [Aureliella sp.]
MLAGSDAKQYIPQSEAVVAIEHRESENLLRDGVVYEPRLLMCGDCGGRETVEVFFGFRPQGGWSVYFDEDPVLQFTRDGLLRRMYWDKQKYSAINGRLVQLSRGEVGGRIKMQQIALGDDGHQRLLTKAADLLAAVLAAIDSGRLQVVGHFPEQGDAPVEQAVTLVRVALDSHAENRLAVAPQAGANQ